MAMLTCLYYQNWGKKMNAHSVVPSVRLKAVTAAASQLLALLLPTLTVLGSP